MFFNFRQRYQVMKDHSKIRKMHFWMIQRAKIEVFSHFLEFGLLDRLDIAYCDGTKCFLTFDNSTRLGRIIQKLQKCIFEWCKEPIHLVYSQYLEFGLLYRLYIGYCDNDKCFPTFGNITRSWRSARFIQIISVYLYNFFHIYFYFMHTHITSHTLQTIGV